MKYAYFKETGETTVQLYDANDNAIENPIDVEVKVEGGDVEHELMRMGHFKEDSFENNTDKELL